MKSITIVHNHGTNILHPTSVVQDGDKVVVTGTLNESVTSRLFQHSTTTHRVIENYRIILHQYQYDAGYADKSFF